MNGRRAEQSFPHLLAEMLLVAIGVFLALLANNWNEDRQHRQKAKQALRYFVGEMEANRQAMQSTRAYHETLARELTQFLNTTEPATQQRLDREVHYEGVRPVIFEHTAWDLALATQALSYLEPRLAFDISKVYTQQNAFQTLENSFLASAFAPTSMSPENVKGLTTAIVIYLRDVNIQEPAILQLYDKVIPELKGAL